MLAQTLRPGRVLPSPALIAVGVAAGVIGGLAVVVGLSFVRPVFFYFALGGLVLLLPTLVIREPKAYWLFLFGLSVSVELLKRTTEWLIDPLVLLNQYGASTISLDIYAADAVLFVMMVPWLLQLCRREVTLYFPRICYIFVLYLAWALIVSLAASDVLYASIFAWFRSVLYFLSFLYLINNVVTRTHLRAVMLALFVGLVAHSGIVIGFYYAGVGTETHLFASLYQQREHKAHVNVTTLHEAQSGSGADVKRSAGAFGHPAQAAYYLVYILPVALAYLLEVRRAWYRILLAGVTVIGGGGLYFTFSRAGLVGLAAAILIYLPIARSARLISRGLFVSYIFAFAAGAIVAGPLLERYIEARPQATSARLDMYKAVVNDFWQKPLLPTFGGGLDNSTMVINSLIGELTVGKHTTHEHQAIHDHYLEVLADVGVVGFVLFFGFFGTILLIGVRTARKIDREAATLVVGMIVGILGIAVFNLADTFLYHVANAMLWFYAGVIVAAARYVPAVRASPVRSRLPAAVAPGQAGPSPA